MKSNCIALLVTSLLLSSLTHCAHAAPDCSHIKRKAGTFAYLADASYAPLTGESVSLGVLTDSPERGDFLTAAPFYIVASPDVRDNTPGDLAVNYETHAVKSPCKGIAIFKLEVGIAPLNFDPGKFDFANSLFLTNKDGDPIEVGGPKLFAGELKMARIRPSLQHKPEQTVSLNLQANKPIKLEFINAGNLPATLEDWTPEFDNAEIDPHRNQCANHELKPGDTCATEMTPTQAMLSDQPSVWRASLKSSSGFVEFGVEKDRHGGYMLWTHNH